MTMDKCFYWIWAYPYKTHIQSWVDIQLTWSTRTLDIIAISISSMCLAAKPTNFDWLNCHFYSKMYAQLCVIYPFNFFFFITRLFLSTALFDVFHVSFLFTDSFFPIGFLPIDSLQLLLRIELIVCCSVYHSVPQSMWIYQFGIVNLDEKNLYIYC